MSRKKSGLTALQEAAITLLVSGYSSYQTAVLLGLEHSFVVEWLNYDSSFRNELEKRRQKAALPLPPTPTKTITDTPAQVNDQNERMKEPVASQRKGDQQREAIGALYDLIDSKSQQHEEMIRQLRKSESLDLRVSLYLSYVREEQENIKSLHKVIAELMKEQ